VRHLSFIIDLCVSTCVANLTGYAFGYLLAAVINLTVVQYSQYHWRSLFFIGAGFSLAAAIVRACLPESRQFLLAREEARANPNSGGGTKVFFKEMGAMFKTNWLRCIWAICMMTGTSRFRGFSTDKLEENWKPRAERLHLPKRIVRIRRILHRSYSRIQLLIARQPGPVPHVHRKDKGLLGQGRIEDHHRIECRCHRGRLDRWLRLAVRWSPPLYFPRALLHRCLHSSVDLAQYFRRIDCGWILHAIGSPGRVRVFNLVLEVDC
jgi:hypothetical protein